MLHALELEPFIRRINRIMCKQKITMNLYANIFFLSLIATSIAAEKYPKKCIKTVTMTITTTATPTPTRPSCTDTVCITSTGTGCGYIRGGCYLHTVTTAIDTKRQPLTDCVRSRPVAVLILRYRVPLPLHVRFEGISWLKLELYESIGYLRYQFHVPSSSYIVCILPIPWVSRCDPSGWSPKSIAPQPYRQKPFRVGKHAMQHGPAILQFNATNRLREVPIQESLV